MREKHNGHNEAREAAGRYQGGFMDVSADDDVLPC
jgi:hypothetical protein